MAMRATGGRASDQTIASSRPDGKITECPRQESPPGRQTKSHNPPFPFFIPTLPGASNALRPARGGLVMSDVPGCLRLLVASCSLDWWGHGPSSLFPS
eukprot:scaffold5064_cov115-Isochrysis_galbana.AAC.10